MRKIVWAIVAILVVSVSLTGCNSEKKDKNGSVTGAVTSVDASRLGDTIRSMKVVVDDGDTLIFNMHTAKYDNELMVPDDSVVVNYVDDGHSDTLRALDVTVIPRKGTVVNLDSMRHNKLITR